MSISRSTPYRKLQQKTAFLSRGTWLARKSMCPAPKALASSCIRPGSTTTVRHCSISKRQDAHHSRWSSTILGRPVHIQTFEVPGRLAARCIPPVQRRPTIVSGKALLGDGGRRDSDVHHQILPRGRTGGAAVRRGGVRGAESAAAGLQKRNHVVVSIALFSGLC